MRGREEKYTYSDLEASNEEVIWKIYTKIGGQC
jgi:hypothetical protein